MTATTVKMAHDVAGVPTALAEGVTGSVSALVGTVADRLPAHLPGWDHNPAHGAAAWRDHLPALEAPTLERLRQLAEVGTRAVSAGVQAGVDPALKAVQGNVAPAVRAVQGNVAPAVRAVQGNVAPAVRAVQSNVEPAVRAVQANMAPDRRRRVIVPVVVAAVAAVGVIVVVRSRRRRSQAAGQSRLDGSRAAA